MPNKRSKTWIQNLKTEDTVDESEGTFSGNSTAQEIAKEIKRSSPDYQAAIAKVQLYLNRAGKRLSEARRKEIKKAQDILRNLYNREDRALANKSKKANVKTAMYHVVWVDKEGNEHMGDAYIEALTKNIDEFLRIHPEVSRKEIEEYVDFLVSWEASKHNNSIPKDEDAQKKYFDKVKKDMLKAYRRGDNFPIFDLSERKPAIVPKVACIQTYDLENKPQIVFSSEEKALQFLADISKKIIKIKE